MVALSLRHCALAKVSLMETQPRGEDEESLGNS